MIEPNGTLVLDVAPVRAEPAGVGLYAALLARELVRRAPFPVALIGVRPEALSLRDLDPVVPRSPFSKRSYHAWMQLAADADARSLNASLVHFTNAAAPVIGRVPYVVTVHDLSLMRMPMTHPASRWGILPVNLAAIARAQTLIVPSSWTARELERIGVDRRRITIIPHAPTLQPPLPGSDSVARMGLKPGGYVLYFGTLEPRKNLIRLVGAFEQVAHEQPELRLVLAGAKGWRYAGLERRIAESPVRQRIDMPGYVADVDLAPLIVDSAAVAYVSVYEGFGLPVLDAMALGAAVVTSRTTSMPEAAGGAAILVDPLDEADIARGIGTAIARRSELVERGLVRAATRSWSDVADEHIRVYRHVMRRL